jgi:putative redox protein
MAGELKVELSQVSASASEASIGRHLIPIDRPVAKGGSDGGPMGGELFLASVGGCFMSNLLAAIKAREAAVSDVRLEVIGTLSDAPPTRFSRLELRVTADTPDIGLLEKLTEIADRGCIMMNTLRDTLDLSVSAEIATR